MNLAEQEIRNWAWVCGAFLLPHLLLVLDAKSELAPELKEVPTLVREIVTTRLNQRDRSNYLIIRETFEELALEARLVLKLPKTLPALRRESHPFRRVERDLYHEFLRYGIAVAEVMVFAFRVGIFGLVTDHEEYFEIEKEETLNAWENSALRAEEDFEKYRSLFQRYVDGDIDPTDLIEGVTEIFCKVNPGGHSNWKRFADAVMLSPNVAGVGIDIKKLLSQ